MNRLIREWYIWREVLSDFNRMRGYGASSRQALIETFSRKGKYRIDDGPWVKGSLYDLARHKYKK